MLKALKNFLRLQPVYILWRTFLTWFGNVMLATQPPKVRASHIRTLLGVAVPGDILLRKYNYALDSFFIPGLYSHSGVVVECEQIIHSIAEGVSLDDLIDFVKDCDGFLLLRPHYQDEDAIEQATIYAHQHVGCPYDFLFELNQAELEKNAYYCHELSYFCVKAGGVVVPVAGPHITCDDFVKCFNKVYEVAF